MSKEELTLENFNSVFTTLDRSTSLISEYLTLQTQTTLLFKLNSENSSTGSICANQYLGCVTDTDQCAKATSDL
jgi:hypothetical protein